MNPHDNDMNVNEHEALLTAYALGETDAAETAQVEALLATDAGARALVDEVRATAALLTDGLAAESAEHLPVTSREAVTAAASEPAPAGRVRSFWPLVGMAASIAAGVGLAGWLYPSGPGSTMKIAESSRTSQGPQMAMSEAAPRPARSSFTSGGTIDYGDASTARADELRRGGDGQGTLEAGAPVTVTEGSESTPAKATDGYLLGGVPTTYPGVDVVRPSAGSEGGATSGANAPRTGGAIHVFGRSPETKPGSAVASGGPGGAGGVGSWLAEPERIRASGGGGAHALNGAGDDGAVAPGDRSAITGLVSEEPPADATVLRVQVEEMQKQIQLGLEGAKLPTALVTTPSADVKVVRRFLQVAADEDIEATKVAEVWDAYNRVLADARRIQADDFRRRHGVSYGIPGSEDYAHPGESTFRMPTDEPLSTFSIDVDTASYANVRRFLNNGQLPPPAAVRIEEMVNYFEYSDPAPQGDHPIAATLETATCPWNTQSRLVRVGVKAKTFDEPAPAANLVFLIDVSGSMRPADKLPLLQRAMSMLADQMREGDRVAIVTYASNSGVRLQSTDGSEKDAIKGCIGGLAAGGSTNGGSGIIDAYRIAQENFIEGGVNRVILATDGDFNVGVTDRGELTTLIEQKAKSGVFLSVLGVGTGNLKDATLERLADRGNGNYHYLDGLREARKVLVDEMLGTMVTVAKDVKIQIEFNPATVGAYRLIGYENRMLAAADFNDDTKDAGEMGAGHTVTALYEIIPVGTAPQEGVDALRYQKPDPAELTEAAASGELLTLKVRYKQPEGNESTRFDMNLTDSGAKFDEASEDLRFASAVASFGMLLRGSPAAAGTSHDAVLELAQSAIGRDEGGHRAEFLDLVLKAKKLSGR